MSSLMRKQERVFHLPQLNTQTTFTKKFRYAAYDGSTPGVTFKVGSLLTLLLMATSATASFGIIQSARIKEIELWGANGGSGTPSTIYVQWAPAAENACQIQASDTSLSVDYPAHVRSRPPKGSAAEFWQGTPQIADEMFSIGQGGCSSYAVDLTVELVLSNGGIGIATTVSGATAGAIYFPSLDAYNGTGYYPPVSGEAGVAL